LGLLPADEAKKKNNNNNNNKKTPHEIWYQAKMLSFNEFFVGTNQWLYDTKACSFTKVNDDHDNLPVQIETQNVDVENGNEIDASHGRGNAGGEDEDEEDDQIQPQDSISNVQSMHRGAVVDPPVVDPPLLQPDSGQGQNRPYSWLKLLLRTNIHWRSRSSS